MSFFIFIFGLVVRSCPYLTISAAKCNVAGGPIEDEQKQTKTKGGQPANADSTGCLEVIERLRAASMDTRWLGSASSLSLFPSVKLPLHGFAASADRGIEGASNTAAFKLIWQFL
jgi:hypothetical protein